MKKNFFYALMSAIALTSAVGFTACSSDSDAVVENNPTYDGTGVRTDFAFNVTKASQGTRMSANNVQEANNFLGMTNMYLFPFKGEPGSENKTTIQANYPLGELEGISESASSRVYSLTIPVGTDNFLFYARAKKDGTNFEQGILNSTLIHNGSDATEITTAAGVTSIDNISFGLEPIQTSLGTDATKIAGYLTQIARTTGWPGTVTTAATDGNYQALARLYNKFTSNYNARSGSTESVVRTVLDLYKSAYAINNQSSISGVRDIAMAICKQIESEVSGVKFTIKATADESATEVVIDGDNNPATPPYISPETADNWVASISGVEEDFPASLGLPMGAAQLQWSTTAEKFVYIDSPYYAASEAYTASTDLDKYCYPAELVYFDNSPLRATDTYQKVSDYPTTTTAWDTKYQADTWADTEVKPSTRAVAMTNNVNYGVALLQTQVQLASLTLEDNMKGIAGGDNNQSITVTDVAGEDKSNFFVTGLLIGGQPESVDWNMVNPDDDFVNVIYDNDITFKETPLGEELSAKNYTVVLDNYCDGTQKDVLIALQIKNGKDDFYGVNGVIPAGSTFYLVGQLVKSQSTNDWSGADPTTSAKVDRPATYRITNEGTKRIFVQDYKTTVGITIKADALKNAYSTIPDLRSTEVLFGLSVDLKWEKGLNFNIEM